MMKSFSLPREWPVGREPMRNRAPNVTVSNQLNILYISSLSGPSQPWASLDPPPKTPALRSIDSDSAPEQPRLWRQRPRPGVLRFRLDECPIHGRRQGAQHGGFSQTVGTSLGFAPFGTRPASDLVTFAKLKCTSRFRASAT
jgi:hypothetical protein